MLVRKICHSKVQLSWDTKERFICIYWRLKSVVALHEKVFCFIMWNKDPALAKKMQRIKSFSVCCEHVVLSWRQCNVRRHGCHRTTQQIDQRHCTSAGFTGWITAGAVACLSTCLVPFGIKWSCSLWHPTLFLPAHPRYQMQAQSLITPEVIITGHGWAALTAHQWLVLSINCLRH